MATASFGTLVDPEQQAIERQRALAAALQQQSTTPIQSPMGMNGMVGRISPIEGLAKLAQALAGKSAEKEADTAQNAYTAKQVGLANDFVTALNGTPATPEAMGNNPSAYQPPRAAVAPDQSKAMAIALKSPMLAGEGGKLIDQQMRMAMIRHLMGQQPGATQQPGVSDGSTPSGVSGAPQGGIPGVDPRALALTLSGDPAAEKVGAMIQDTTKPMINRGFGINKLNPKTGNYELDPGSLQGIKDVEEAKAVIQANHDRVRVDMGNGQYSYIPRSELAGQPQQPPMPQGQSSQMPVQPAVQQSPQPEAGVRGGFQGNPSDVAMQIAGIKDPQEKANAQAAFESQMRLTKGNLAGRPVYGQSTADKALQESQGATAGVQEAKINADAESALAKLAQNNKMMDLIPSITTGPGAKALTTVRTLAQNLGVDIGDPAPNQEFEKYAIKGALEGAKQIYGTRLTNMDVMSQIASNPGTTMADKALYQLIKWDNEIQQRHLDKQKAYFAYQGPKNQFEMNFNQQNPLMGLTAPGAGQNASQSAPARPIPAQPAAAPTSKLRQNPNGTFTYTP